MYLFGKKSNISCMGHFKLCFFQFGFSLDFKLYELFKAIFLRIYLMDV